MSDRDLITSPATGLLIYQTDNTPGFYYFNGTVWLSIVSTDDDWIISGNDIYNANTGNVGVGNASPSAKLHITGTSVSCRRIYTIKARFQFTIAR